MKLTLLTSEMFVIGVETPSGEFKSFQINCKCDGSILVPFPHYKKYSPAQLIKGTLRAGRGIGEDLSVWGSVTAHRMKYTHHVGGEAHFSQDGKILTRIRNNANLLPSYEGHMFTIQLQGLQDLKRQTERDTRDRRKTVDSLRFEHPEDYRGHCVAPSSDGRGRACVKRDPEVIGAPPRDVSGQSPASDRWLPCAA